MRLVTFQPAGGTPHVGAVVGDQVFPLDSSVYPDMTSFLSAGSEALAEAEKIDRGESQTHTKHHLTDVTLLPPVTRPGKIIAVGLNYRDHAIETKQDIPTVPIIFAKFPSSINGPDAPVVLPQGRSTG
jgi:2-keto-4-pentenoate hydratase/2-oxohepta-3-ene-1,7-dioic acid hydratase in catechol pathway